MNRILDAITLWRAARRDRARRARLGIAPDPRPLHDRLLAEVIR